jgi:hypothetical protein
MADEYDYWVSFIIKDERGKDGRSYAERYNAVCSAVKDAASLIWDETTSFYLARSTFSIDELCVGIKAAIDPSKDTVLLRRLDSSAARILGVFYDDALNKFLPYLKRG